MNNFLLDTHIFIWAMEGNKFLSKSIRNKIADPSHEVFVSVASIWEIVIKRNLKKIQINFDIETSIRQAGIEILPIKVSHVLATEKLPHYHKDPFDRMLIAQTIVEHLTLVTDDVKMKKYDVKILE